ncbi:YdeI/OmpD-associated family protein [Tenacibaculum sp.]|uniref:YdeI/OmpD-associated family protein n=1 Tax=Tenacibaculum sp. TaxID=1906242 RepID=UPI003D0EC744
MEMKDGKPAVYFKTRKEWRNWLEKNCETEKNVWLILHKKNSTKECVSLIDATEEAVCFGWIDSLCKKRDNESYYLTFTPRNPKRSNWSDRNIERAERMIEQGLMTENGRKHIAIAKEKGKWKNL